MRPLDADIARADALVVDGNPSSRAVLTAMLRDCGVASVVQAMHAQDARRLLGVSTSSCASTTSTGRR